jgi:hypothetical protein
VSGWGWGGAGWGGSEAGRALAGGAAMQCLHEEGILHEWALGRAPGGAGGKRTAARPCGRPPRLRPGLPALACALPRPWKAPARAARRPRTHPQTATSSPPTCSSSRSPAAARPRARAHTPSRTMAPAACLQRCGRRCGQGGAPRGFHSSLTGRPLIQGSGGAVSRTRASSHPAPPAPWGGSLRFRPPPPPPFPAPKPGVGLWPVVVHRRRRDARVELPRGHDDPHEPRAAAGGQGLQGLRHVRVRCAAVGGGWSGCGRFRGCFGWLCECEGAL